MDGLLPRAEPEDSIPVDELGEDPGDFANYAGVETDPKAVDILEGYLRKGWMEEKQVGEEDKGGR